MCNFVIFLRREKKIAFRIQECKQFNAIFDQIPPYFMPVLHGHVENTRLLG